MTSNRGSAVGIALALAVFVLTLPAVTTRVNASDEIQFFSWLHSWTFDGDADFDNEYRYFHDAGPGRNPGFVETFLEATNEAGRRPNFAPIGSAILWLPFYGAGHVWASMSGAAADGFSAPYVTAVTWASALYGFLALLFSADIARRLTGRQGAVPAAVVLLGTPLVFYMYVAPAFAHACSAFAVSLFIWTWLRVRGQWSVRGAVAVGVTGALAAMVREQDLFFVAGPALDFLRWAWLKHPSRTASPATITSLMRCAAAGAISFSLAYAPQLIAYTALNGHPTPTEKVARKMTWTSPHALEVLFSPQHGLFMWTPLALLALAGIVRLCFAGAAVRARPAGYDGTTRHAAQVADVQWIAALLLLMAALQVYVSGSVESWTVAGAFGQRRFVALTPILVAGLAVWAPTPASSTVWKTCAAGAAALALWWNLGLMAQFGLHLMDRQRLTLRENARLTFIELPRMAPSILLRYFTDRESFYGQNRD